MSGDKKTFFQSIFTSHEIITSVSTKQMDESVEKEMLELLRKNNNKNNENNDDEAEIDLGAYYGNSVTSLEGLKSFGMSEKEEPNKDLKSNDMLFDMANVDGGFNIDGGGKNKEDSKLDSGFINEPKVINETDKLINELQNQGMQNSRIEQPKPAKKKASDLFNETIEFNVDDSIDTKGSDDLIEKKVDKNDGYKEDKIDIPLI